jgi:hypothetical protein
LAQNARRSQPYAAIIERIRPEKERETKTAKFRMSRPDLASLFQADLMMKQASPKNPTLERR